MKKLITVSFAIALFAASAVHASAIVAHPKIDQIEMGFSPEGEAQDLVLKVIQSARHNIRIMAYSFTSKPVVKALIAARRRGIDILIAADSSNINSKSGEAALSTLVTAGIAVRTVNAYRIMHDKIILVDDKTLELGSFNYTKSAASANSENVMVIWNAPEVVKPYLQHWQSRWDRGTAFHTKY